MKKLLALFVGIFLTSISAHSQYKSDKNTVYKDTADNVLDRKIFFKVYGKGNFKMIPKMDTITKTITELKAQSYTTAEIEKRAKMREVKIVEGTNAPIFSVTTIDEKTYNLSELKGKIVVLNFWFIACGPCRKEMPELKELTDKFADKNIVFLSIALDKKNKLQEFLTNNDFGFSVATMNKEIEEKYGVQSYPTNIVIDSSGKVVFSQVGYSGSLRKLTKAIEKAIQVVN